MQYTNEINHESESMKKNREFLTGIQNTIVEIVRRLSLCLCNKQALLESDIPDEANIMLLVVILFEL